MSNAVFVAIDGATGSFDKKFTYLVPEEYKDISLSGRRVSVPFGLSNRTVQAMVLSEQDGYVETGKEKSLISVLDNEPILNDEMLKLCEFMKERTFCTYYDAIRVCIPAGFTLRFSKKYSVAEGFDITELSNGEELALYCQIRDLGVAEENKLKQLFGDCAELLSKLEKRQAIVSSSDVVRRVGDLTRKYVRLNGQTDIDTVKLTPRQKEIVELVETAGEVSVKELQYFTGVTASVINALTKKSILVSFEKEELRTPVARSSRTEKKPITLTDEQNIAYSGLKEKMLSGKSEVSLLYGVTGSGKTQVFLKLVDDCVDNGKGVIIMVPEIALTPQIINIFCTRYGDKISVFHSAMSLGKRLDEYKRIKNGKSLIAIGTRSAVFAPFCNLGLVIMDEEQEHTYKSEMTPRYNCKDIARFRISYHNALLLLASATPSMESYSNAKSGNYSLFSLPHRYNDFNLPDVTVVDMKKEILDGNTSSVSRELAQAIENELSAGKQVILLLNRRGHNTYVSCPNCGYVASCPNCSVSLTYHSANKRLMCHYCGYSVPVESKCPECGSEHLRFLGAGTQKLEEELNLLFKNARVLRLDADSTMTRDSYSSKLTAFANGEYNILLGTQMVAKGLDFKNVTLVGVIGADMALYSDDYRGFERTFSLLTQVVGRAGRAGNNGRAIIQTVDPQSSVIKLAKEQNYTQFYENEILNRKVMVYPPYCDICMVCSQSTDKTAAADAINLVFEKIKAVLYGDFSDIKLIILGPSPAVIPKVNNRYRYRMIIKCKNSTRFRNFLRECINIKTKKDTTVWVDFNPENII